MHLCAMRPLRVPVSIMLALVIGLCAACSVGPPRDHLDAAAIDAFFLPLIEAAREEPAQKATPPPIYPEDGIDKFHLGDLQVGQPVLDAEWLSPGKNSSP